MDFLFHLNHSTCRFESYSCKMAGNDKRLFKTLSHEPGMAPNDLQALSPPQGYLAHSPSRLVTQSLLSVSLSYLCISVYSSVVNGDIFLLGSTAEAKAMKGKGHYVTPSLLRHCFTSYLPLMRHSTQIMTSVTQRVKNSLKSLVYRYSEVVVPVIHIFD